MAAMAANVTAQPAAGTATSAEIAATIADLEQQARGLDESIAALRARADQADADVVDRQADAALGGSAAAVQVAEDAAGKLTQDLTVQERQRKRIAGVLEQLRARHRAARVAEIDGEIAALVPEWHRSQQRALAGAQAVLESQSQLYEIGDRVRTLRREQGGANGWSDGRPMLPAQLRIGDGVEIIGGGEIERLVLRIGLQGLVAAPSEDSSGVSA